MMNGFVFKYTMDDREVMTSIANDEMTWKDLSQEFFMFLQGAGYVLTREDFTRYWVDEVFGWEDETDEDQCCGQCEQFEPVTVSVDTSPGARAFDNMAATLTNPTSTITWNVPEL